MITRGLGCVGRDEVPVPDDLLPADHEPVDALRAGEHEAGNSVGRPPELQPVRAPYGEVGALAGLEGPEIGAVEDRGPAARPEPEGLAGGHRRRAAAATRDEKRLLDLEKEV